MSKEVTRKEFDLRLRELRESSDLAAGHRFACWTVINNYVEQLEVKLKEASNDNPR